MIEIPELYTNPQGIPDGGSMTLALILITIAALFGLTTLSVHFWQLRTIRANRATQQRERRLLQSLEQVRYNTGMAAEQLQDILDDAGEHDPQQREILDALPTEPPYKLIRKLQDDGFDARRTRALQNHFQTDYPEPSADIFGNYQLSYRPIPMIALAIACALTGAFGGFEYGKASDDQLQQEISDIQQANDDAMQSVQDQIDSTYGDTIHLQYRRSGMYAAQREDFIDILTKPPYRGTYEKIDLSLRLDDGTITEDAHLIRQSSEGPDISHTVHLEVPDGHGKVQTYTAE